VSYPDGRVRRYLPVEAEKLQGFPDGWTIPDSQSDGDLERINSLRYKALGNAVTVPVANWLAERICLYLSQVPGVEAAGMQPSLRPLEKRLVEAF
jgi:DNA (cytosine-5)-methyltransferase 1